MNILDNKMAGKEVYVTHLKDTKNMETASSSGTVDTVISLDKLKICDDNKEIPSVIVTRDSIDSEKADNDLKMYGVAQSHTPSTKSRSTLSTVQEVTSFKSNDSPVHSSKGGSNIFCIAFYLFFYIYLSHRHVYYFKFIEY